MSYPFAEIEAIQPECFSKLASEAWFSTVSLFLIRYEDIQSKINSALAVESFDPGQAGKLPGATIEVFMPMLKCEHPNTSTPAAEIEMLFRVKENHEINMDAGGTGLTAEQIAARILRVFSQWYNDGLTTAWYPAPDCISYTQDFSPLVCQDVKLRTELDFTALSQTATPAWVEAAPLTIALSCLTPAAAIYYTTDGSYPDPAALNPAGANTALLYTGPFAIAAGQFVRYSAQSPGNTNSNIGRTPILNT